MYPISGGFGRLVGAMPTLVAATLASIQQINRGHHEQSGVGVEISGFTPIKGAIVGGHRLW
jgi:hypothetical protein